jgi:hypothetical protein
MKFQERERTPLSRDSNFLNSDGDRSKSMKRGMRIKAGVQETITIVIFTKVVVAAARATVSGLAVEDFAVLNVLDFDPLDKQIELLRQK